MNILFVCSRNEWRSRTAETIFKKNQYHQVKSAGTSSTARIKVSEKILLWADLVFVMEKKHKQIIDTRYPDIVSNKPLIVLDVLDEYSYMDSELILELKDLVSEYVDNLL